GPCRPLPARARAPLGPVLDAPRRVRAGLQAPVARPVRHARPLSAALHLISAPPRTPEDFPRTSIMSVTYSSYLKIDELLALQQPLSDGPEHDEMLFIIIHQVYELWFKEMVHELDFLMGTLRRGDVARAQHTLKRVLTILKVLVHQIDILETMTPLEFLS